MIIAAFRECYDYRGLFTALLRRELRMRYGGSALGYLWTLASPLFQVAVFTVVFSIIIKTGVAEYPLFLLTALLPWTWLTVSLLASSEALVFGRGLIKKAYFPSELLPLVSITTNMIVFLASLPVLALALAWSGHTPGLAWLALPSVVAVQYLCIVAVALPLAMLQAFYRDVGYLLGVLLPLWTYLTPILYPASFVPPWLAPWLALNPMAGLVESYRAIFLQDAWPAPVALGSALLWGTLVFAVTYPVFLRRRHLLAEVL